MSVEFFFGVGGVVYSGVSIYRIVGGAMDGFMGLYICVGSMASSARTGFDLVRYLVNVAWCIRIGRRRKLEQRD